MQDLLLDSSYSLVRQSRHARMRFEPVNGDGFGVGWYPEHGDPVPGTFVSIEPAWSNRNLRQLAAKILTRHFFAHVRDATPGMPVSQANCHPFQHGEWLWMHNGFLGQFDKCRRGFLAALSDETFGLVRGNTDTEHTFALFLDEIGRAENGAPVRGDTAHMLTALNNTIRRITEIRQAAGCDNEAHMNFAVTNGRTALYTRYSSHADRPPPTLFHHCEGNTCIVASEPLSESAKWTAVDAGHVLVLEAGKALEVQSLAP